MKTFHRKGGPEERRFNGKDKEGRSSPEGALRSTTCHICYKTFNSEREVRYHKER
jgi:hypothetical protein